MRGLVATSTIPAGEILGQYLGHLLFLGPPCINGSANKGFRMHIKTRAKGNQYLGIDALRMGFVSLRHINRGEEVTVSYGNRLWFICRSGWSGCQHRDIQHLLDFCPERAC
ncbi:uncharacterized protein PITG_21423 [Phytophthora infestans T30-4]|uniref:SET domain-containing protein n=1 Tax=Phytophthora infestans (strain T30-4) TaxID=403677 RepID=D0P420_PHYIT|nr:uncharacterized protein PITG_21423 [Phytophthora infestans T30-4]EEY62543.1 hypothetical protein PITG_21423 [Phytophthora infestans T30-4]|eukprot:XP_002894955.1 hypothetical protein PITG_21423 [Phytophthora infestans T30-4]